jgi:uncharacterized DUF497 family protein
MEFEWNLQKSEANLIKHKVSFEGATSVFGCALSFTFPDRHHSIQEQRYLIIGLSQENRILVISHVYRANESIRLISARLATKKEQKFYESGQ